MKYLKSKGVETYRIKSLAKTKITCYTQLKKEGGLTYG